MTSKVSVIVPSYNHYDFLTERLDSIFNQSYTDFEVIIIDDLSTDSSKDILLKYAEHPKVKHFILNESNSGSGYQSWLKGINMADSEYVWIAETDDVNELSFLEQTVQILDNNKDLALVFTASNYINKEGEFLYNTDNRMKDLGVNDGDYKIFGNDIFLNKLPLSPYITNASAVVFRKPTSIPSQIFSFKQMSDLFLWRYLVEDKKIAFLNKKLNHFRRHESSTTFLNYTANKSMIYDEFVEFANYFKCSKTIKVAIVKEYLYNFILTKLNKKGIFYLGPMKKLQQISRTKLRFLYLKFLLQLLILKLKKI